MSLTRTPRRTTAGLAVATMVVLALGACGTETADDPGDPAAGEGFDVSAATLTDEPFCDQLDTAAVADVLGLPAEKVRTQVDREVGEEFEGPNEEAAPPTSVANLCAMGSGTSQMIVSVQPDATEADVQKSIDELAALTGEESSETCSSSDASAFGDPAGSFTCTSNPPVERVRVVHTGLVGDSKFYCAAMVNRGARADLAEATTDTCEAVLEQLASGA